jgi:hypothetical protein
MERLRNPWLGIESRGKAPHRPAHSEGCGGLQRFSRQRLKIQGQSPAISRVPKKPDSPFDPCAMMSMIFPIWTNAKHENFSKP